MFFLVHNPLVVSIFGAVTAIDIVSMITKPNKNKVLYY